MSGVQEGCEGIHFLEIDFRLKGGVQAKSLGSSSDVSGGKVAHKAIYLLCFAKLALRLVNC